MSVFKDILFISSFVMIVVCSQAQARYNLIYEEQIGMNFAAENLVSIYHAYDVFDSILVPKRIFAHQGIINKVGNSFFRLNKLFWLNYLINDYVHTMNHERFGHGYRVIDNGGKIINIVYNLPPPFGNEFSRIYWRRSTNHTLQQDILNTIGGSEVGLITSDIIRKNILLDENLSYNLALPYLYGNNDLPGYTVFQSKGDPESYVKKLNEFYPNANISINKLKRYSYIALFTDPLNFFAMKAAFYDYLIKGKHSSKVKMIQLADGVKYLPRFRVEYTPYGPELVLQNFLKLHEKLFQFNFSHSDGTFEPSWRALVNIWNIRSSHNLLFNFSGQLWKQPSIDYFVDDTLTRSEGLGGQLLLGINYDFITNNHILGVVLNVGYKTKGFSIGEQIDQGLIIRGGLSFKL